MQVEAVRTRNVSVPRAHSQTRPWNKEYLPGYTGFVPTKNGLFGKTQGAINREVIAAEGKEDKLLTNAMITSRYEGQKKGPLCHGHHISSYKPIFGNRSRYESTWICGPTHGLRDQHVPHYQGEYQGKIDAGIIPKSYAKITAHMLNTDV